MVSRLRHSLSQLILNVIHLLNLRRTLVVSYSVGLGFEHSNFELDLQMIICVSF